MGNFSRNTFDPSKNYVGVRLQQGVPLVDADWNELNDVLRHETHQGLSLINSSGYIDPLLKRGIGGITVEPFLPFVVASNPLENDFFIVPSPVLVNGFPLNIEYDFSNQIQYSKQPWADRIKANADGVSIVPQLTTPSEDRIDIVYLDVWQREVDSIEDISILNQTVGIETCVRLRPEITIRVAEGETNLPPKIEGHEYLPLALLVRSAGQSSLLGETIIHDIRPVSGPSGSHYFSFPPIFVKPSSSSLGWDYTGQVAVKSSPNDDVFGLLPLQFPHGIKLIFLSISGYTKNFNFAREDAAKLEFSLDRVEIQPKLTNGNFSINRETLIPIAYRNNHPELVSIEHPSDNNQNEYAVFNQEIFLPVVIEGRGYFYFHTVDNTRFNYSLRAQSNSKDFQVIITGIQFLGQYDDTPWRTAISARFN